ncbi:short chain dehydrogenase, partial [Apiospora sp. TS-2023a]
YFGFLRHSSEDSTNLVIGLVRDKAAPERKVAAELGGRPNVHILHGDLTNYASLKQGPADAADIVAHDVVSSRCGTLAYLIANRAAVAQLDAYDPIGKMGEKVEELEATTTCLFQTNVTGNIQFFNLFIPWPWRARSKRFITISSGQADVYFFNNFDIKYLASKATLNVTVAKFNAQYKNNGRRSGRWETRSFGRGFVTADHDLPS